MVHQFYMHGKFIAYDSETSSIYELDALSYDVLGLFIENKGKTPEPKAIEQLHFSKSYPLEELFLCQEDFESLIQQQALFSLPQAVTLEELYPDEPKIKAMCLHLCHDCNLRCRYCFASTGDFGTGHRDYLDLETGKKAIDFLIAASGNRQNLDIDFFGGEPLMNWEVVTQLVEYCHVLEKTTGKNLRLTITTNALLLDEEKTKYINQHFKNCVLSIDGRPQVHDYMRPTINQKGSYQITQAKIKDFIQQRTDVSSPNQEYYVRGTFTRHNLDFSQDVIHLAKVLKAMHISVEPVVTSSDNDYAIGLEDYPRIALEYENLALALLEETRAGNPIHFFHFINDLTGGPCLYKRLKGCGVGVEYCAVTPQGDIYPCHQFVGQEEFILGNVRQVDIKNPHLSLNKKVIDQFQPQLLPKNADCITCFARYHCGGGCPANNYQTTNSFDQLYEMGCKLTKKRLECALWMKVANEEKA